MRIRNTSLATVLISTMMVAPATLQERTSLPIAEFARRASQDVAATPRVKLLTETSELFRDVAGVESAGSGRVPNYLRARGLTPGAIRPYATAFRTFIYGGTI